MLSAKAIVNFILLAIVVPCLIRKSLSFGAVHGSEIRLNFLGAEASILISAVGVLCVALAFKFWMLLGALMIYASGSALPVFTMSLVKSSLIALGDSDTQDFSIVMLTKTLGSLVGAPLMASLWIQAIKHGGVGLGLPYFVSAVCQQYREGNNRLANLRPDYICRCCGRDRSLALVMLDHSQSSPRLHAMHQVYDTVKIPSLEVLGCICERVCVRDNEKIFACFLWRSLAKTPRAFITQKLQTGKTTYSEVD